MLGASAGRHTYIVSLSSQSGRRSGNPGGCHKLEPIARGLCTLENPWHAPAQWYLNGCESLTSSDGLLWVHARKIEVRSLNTLLTTSASPFTYKHAGMSVQDSQCAFDSGTQCSGNQVLLDT